MAKSKLEIEKEYQEVLSVSQSMLKDLTKMLDDNVKSIDKRNKGQKKFNDELKDALNNTSSYDDISQSILKTEEAFNKLKKDRRRTENGSLGIARVQKNVIIKSLKTEQRRGELISMTNESAMDLADSMSSFIDGIQSTMGPFGKLLNKPFENLKSNINLGAKEFVGSFGTALKDGKSGMQALGVASKNALSTIVRLVNPFTLIALAIGIGTVRFKELDEAAKSFRQTTGLLISQTGALKGNIQTISRDMAVLGVSAEDVATAASDFSNEFSGIEQPSKEVLGSMVMLNKNFGIGTQEASKLNKVFQNLGDLTSEQSQALIGQTVEMAKMAGVAPSKVIKDMADNSEVAYQFFGGSVKELAAAAVEAAAMGTSIAEAGKAARGLLDYQSSVSKELEASSILGTNINLSQARYLAANGDIVGSQQAILDSVSQLGDLTKLNVYEQEALAEATGMEFSSLVNQQRIRERFGKLKKEELAAAQTLLDSGKDLSSLTKEDLNLQTKRMKSQKEMQSLFDNISNQFGSLKTAFFDIFEPLGSFIMPVLSDVVSIVVGVLTPAFKGIGFLIRGIITPLKGVYDMFKLLITEGPMAMMEHLKSMGPVLATITGIVGTLAAIWMISILPSVLSTVVALGTGIIGALVTAIPMIISFAISMASAAVAAISTASAMTLGIGALAIAGGIAAAAVAMDSSIDSTSSKVKNVNDAVISPDGDIISTHPDDFLIATKTPETLGGGGTVNMSGVISELKSLREAFVSNKDVYIDGDRVTAKVTMRQESSGKNQFGMSGA